MKRKGIELPINVLVIIAVAVIVLLGIIALYFGGFIGPAGAMTSEGAKVKYCGLIMKNVTGCAGVDPAQIQIYDYDANKDGSVSAGTAVGACDGSGDDNLQMLATCYYGAVYDPANPGVTKRETRSICGCVA